jgi:transposase
MNAKHSKAPAERVVKDIRRATRKQYSAEEKIRIVLEGLRGEDGIAELCRREGIAQGVYYKWSKDFVEAGKRRLAGDTLRSANTDEVRELRREARDLNEVVTEQALDRLGVARPILLPLVCSVSAVWRRRAGRPAPLAAPCLEPDTGEGAGPDLGDGAGALRAELQRAGGNVY